MEKELGFETIIAADIQVDAETVQTELYCPDCYDCIEYN